MPKEYESVFEGDMRLYAREIVCPKWMRKGFQRKEEFSNLWEFLEVNCSRSGGSLSHGRNNGVECWNQKEPLKGYQCNEILENEGKIISDTDFVLGEIEYHWSISSTAYSFTPRLVFECSTYTFLIQRFIIIQSKICKLCFQLAL